MIWLFRIVKYLPVIYTVIAATHCLLLLMGNDYEVIRLLFRLPIPMAIVMMILSVKFKMCIWHRLTIIYTTAINQCVLVQKHNIFDMLGVDVNYMRIIMLIFGFSIILEICLAYEGGTKRTNGCC